MIILKHKNGITEISHINLKPSIMDRFKLPVYEQIKTFYEPAIPISPTFLERTYVWTGKRIGAARIYKEIK